jgi:3-oxoacyl-[acyl-carrier-protein] synthase-3
LTRKRLACPDAGSIDLFIPHAASDSAAEAGRRAVGIPPEKFFCGHADFGNTVSMAMPTALAHALKAGRARRGERICFLVASSGITYGYGIMTC